MTQKMVLNEAAYIRRRWEDIHQTRRVILAGRQKSKLDPRSDNSGARLLSKEEEARVAAARARKFLRTFLPKKEEKVEYFKVQEGPVFFPQKKGKGKGKGKGRWYSPRWSGQFS